MEDSRNVYIKEPISVKDGIPVFSTEDVYTENYKQIAKDFLKGLEETGQNPFMEEKMWQESENSTKKLIEKYRKGVDSILDAGVGIGRLLAEFSDLERYGIDIAMENLLIAKGKGIEVAFSKIEDMPYKDNSFDMVASTDVLEHVLAFDKCCSEIYRVLKPGGIFILRVPYKEDLTVYLQPDVPYEFIHLRYFDESSLKSYFTKIIKMEFLESSPTTLYAYNSNHLKLRLLDNAQSQAFLNLLAEMQPTHKRFGRIFGRVKDILGFPRKECVKDKLLRKISCVAALSSEDIFNTIVQIREEWPDFYDSIKPHLFAGVEINAVFRKKI